MRRALGVVLIAVVALAACSSGGGDDTAPDAKAADPTTTTTTGPAPPDPTIEVVFTYVNTDPFVRFAAKITNPANQTRIGLRTTWTALDANGVEVGTVEHSERAPIPAGGSIYYVGGAAGSPILTGIPASVEVEISDPGTLTATPPAASATAESPTFKRADVDLFAGARDYDVSFVIAAAHDLDTGYLHTAVLLKDAGGKIIGAAFVADITEMPSTLKASERAKVTAVAHVASGDPASVGALRVRLVVTTGDVVPGTAG